MAIISLTVTDLELLAGQAVKFILLALLCFGCGLNIYLIRKENSGKRKIIRVVIITMFIALSLPLVQGIQIDGSLLRASKYATGTTLGYCQVFAKGKGIAFEYEVDGKQYQNCNTYHPVSIENIIIPGGKYDVRYSKRFPEKGRIDFNKPVK